LRPCLQSRRRPWLRPPAARDAPRLRQYRRQDQRGAGDEECTTQQIDVHVDALLDDARRETWAQSETEHLHGDRVDDDPAPPIEARHCAEQVRVGEVPGKVVDADGDQVQRRAELTDEKVEGHGATDDADGERHGAPVAPRRQRGAERTGNAGELRDGQPVRDLLFGETPGDADQEQVCPDHALGEEVREHRRERDALRRCGQIHRVFFDLHGVLTGHRKALSHGSATSGNNAKNHSTPLKPLQAYAVGIASSARAP
jgi:hypothetical protein